MKPAERPETSPGRRASGAATPRPVFELAQRRLPLRFAAEARQFAEAIASGVGAPASAERCLAGVVERFECPIRPARLMALPPGAIVESHGGVGTFAPDNELRVQVVLAAAPSLEFHLDGEWVVLEPGECWYLDLARPHRMHNRGTASLFLLVLDLIWNDWLRTQFAAGDGPARAPAAPRGAAEFTRFRERVWSDPDLGARLRAPVAEEDFVVAAVREGHRLGFAFGAIDVRTALADGRRKRIETWRA